MPKNTTEVFIPGKAYEIVTAAPFMRGRVQDEPSRKARVALKEGTKRNKGRGYRVLVTLDNDAASYLCEWFNNYLASPAYSKLGTAEALAMRTIAARICEVAKLTGEQKERQKEANARRVAAMQAGRARRRAENAKGARERVDAYSQWVLDDAAYWTAKRRIDNGDPTVQLPPKPAMPVVPSPADYEAVRGVEEAVAA